MSDIVLDKHEYIDFSCATNLHSFCEKEINIATTNGLTCACPCHKQCYYPLTGPNNNNTLEKKENE